jgi:hypothetical protein
VFNNLDALNLSTATTPTYFGSPTPFTINAFFDTSSPDLAPAPPGQNPFNGFRAYAPSTISITIAGQTFTMQSISTNPTAGASIAIFDQNSFTPGRYAVGILQQPPQDGAGIIGDFSDASPNVTVNTLTRTTVFSDFTGVGYSSGVCLQGPSNKCMLNAITPFTLTDSSHQTWLLTLGHYEQHYVNGPDAGAPGLTGPANSAELVAIPEPAAVGLVGAAILL